MCKFPLTVCLQKICAIRFLISKAFQTAKFYQNLISGSGSKQRFSVLKEKAVSDQYFLSYVKKTTGGGVKLPPPSRNRVKVISTLTTQHPEILKNGNHEAMHKYELLKNICSSYCTQQKEHVHNLKRSEAP